MTCSYVSYKKSVLYKKFLRTSYVMRRGLRISSVRPCMFTFLQKMSFLRVVLNANNVKAFISPQLSKTVYYNSIGVRHQYFFVQLPTHTCIFLSSVHLQCVIQCLRFQMTKLFSIFFFFFFFAPKLFTQKVKIFFVISRNHLNAKY